MKRFVNSALLVLCLAAMVDAAEPLRWKFAANDTLAVHLGQQMRLSMEGPNGPLASTVHQQLEMTWHVESIDVAGNAIIHGKFDRIQTSMENADEEQFKYDSADEDAVSGLAAMVAPMYEAMAAGEYEMTISPRGEVGDFHVPEEVAEAIAKSPGVDATGVEAAIEAFQAMIVQGVIPLPDAAPSVGQTWSSRSPVQVPNCESATVATEYRYEGTKEVDGTTVAVIRPTLTLELSGNDKMQTRVKDQTTSGEIHFDIAAGRVRTLATEHRASIEVAVGGQTLAGAIEQKVDVQLSGKN